MSDRKVIIGNDDWVGHPAVILSGVNIGDGAIIAAGSVVTKNVLPFAIVAGVPAKVINYRFEEPTREEEIALKWWEEDPLELESMKDVFLRILTSIVHFLGFN